MWEVEKRRSGKSVGGVEVRKKEKCGMWRSFGGVEVREKEKCGRGRREREGEVFEG